MKALVGAFNQEKAPVGAFSVLRDCKSSRNLRGGSFEGSSIVLTGSGLYHLLRQSVSILLLLAAVSTMGSVAPAEECHSG